MLFHAFYPKKLRDSIYPIKPLRITMKPQHISAGLLSAFALSPGSSVLGTLCRAPGGPFEVTFCQSHLSLCCSCLSLKGVILVWGKSLFFTFFFGESPLCHLILFPEELGFCQMIHINTHIFWNNDDMKPYEQVHKHTENLEVTWQATMIRYHQL